MKYLVDTSFNYVILKVRWEMFTDQAGTVYRYYYLKDKRTAWFLPHPHVCEMGLHYEDKVAMVKWCLATLHINAWSFSDTSFFFATEVDLAQFVLAWS